MERATTLDRWLDEYAAERERLAEHANEFAAELIQEATLYGDHVAYVLDHMAQDRYRCR